MTIKATNQIDKFVKRCYFYNMTYFEDKTRVKIQAGWNMYLCTRLEESRVGSNRVSSNGGFSQKETPFKGRADFTIRITNCIVYLF